DFISQRLEVLVEELSEVEGDAEKFKKENQLTDIITEGRMFVEGLSEVEKTMLDIDTKISIIDTIVKEFIEKDTRGQTFPMVLDGTSMGSALSSAIAEHNRLVMYRNAIGVSAGPENTDILEYDKQIEDYKKNIKTGLLQLKSNLQITRADIAQERSKVRGKISTIPTLEKEYRGISRQQGVKEALFLYLLQKREEAEIAMAALAPNAKVIDSGLASELPISPKRNIIFLAAFILGLLIPFGIIYLYYVLDTKVKRGDLGKVLTIPFVGDVPRSLAKEDMITAHDRSSTAEALRIVRTNMEFVLSQIETDKRAKTIFVTSTLPKEGKTFIAVNLAGTFALSG